MTKLDTVFHVKEQVANAIRNELDVSPRQMRLFTSSADVTSALSDSATMADHDIKDDQCLYVVFQKDLKSKSASTDDDRAWEEIELQNMNLAD